MSKRKFEKFYNSHIDKVYRYVFFRVNQNKETAEDLVSEIFLKALSNFEKYDKKISISAWIMTITKNHLANHWRDRKVTVSIDMIESSVDDEKNGKKSNYSLLAQALTNLRIWHNKGELIRLLDKLNEKDRDIVTSHYLCGYKYTEIAELKKMSTTAVKVHSHRVLKKLKNFK